RTKTPAHALSRAQELDILERSASHSESLINSQRRELIFTGGALVLHTALNRININDIAGLEVIASINAIHHHQETGITFGQRIIGVISVTGIVAWRLIRIGQRSNRVRIPTQTRECLRRIEPAILARVLLT